MWGSILAGIVAILILLFIYLTTFIDDNKREHIFLRLILVFFFLQCIIFVAKGVYEDCDYVLNYTRSYEIYGDNYTGYHWDYLNPPKPTLADVNLFHTNVTYQYTYLCKPVSLTNEKLFTSTLWLQRIFWIYIILYLSYYWLIKYKVIKQK